MSEASDTLNAAIQQMLPCPFCGNKIRENEDAFYPATRPDKNGVQAWRAQCTRCTASVLGWSPEEAIAEWNKRA